MVSSISSRPGRNGWELFRAADPERAWDLLELGGGTMSGALSTLDALAVHLGMLGADFEVSDPPELVDHIRVLAGRYALQGRIGQWPQRESGERLVDLTRTVAEGLLFEEWPHVLRGRCAGNGQREQRDGQCGDSAQAR